MPLALDATGQSRERRDLPREVLYYGKEEALPEQVPLRAGPLTMVYEAGDLRYIKLGDREVVRQWRTLSSFAPNVARCSHRSLAL
jgi:hypothetical protein